MYNIKTIRRLSPLGLLSLVACGGGNTPSNLNISGTVQKGPLENALVFLDYDGDWQLGSTEPSIRTDSDGNFTLTPTEPVYSIVAFTDETTVDSSSGSILSGVTFKAASGSLLINPTTTLVIESDLTVEEIVTVLGLPTGFDPTSFDAFDPNLANSDKLVALAYEKTNHQLMNAVKSFAAAAEGAGASPEKSFSMALASVVDVIKDKAALLENPNASIIDKTIDFTLQSDLLLIQDKAVEKVDLITGIEASGLAAFTEIVGNTSAAIRNVNILIDEITNADLLNSATINTFGTSQVLVSQVKAAVLAEGLVAGTGSILYETISEVIDAAQNGAPTGITLSNNSVGESVSSLLFGTVTTLDLDQDINTAHSYKIVEVEGTDYAAFNIGESSGEMSFVRQPDFETQSSYRVAVSTTDAGGKAFADTFIISVIDDEENSVISGVSTGNLAEDAGALLEASGTLAVSDEDAVSEPFLVAQDRTEGSAGLGYFQIDTEGVWAYTAYNGQTVVQALRDGETVEDSFTVHANDGTTQVVTITISGQNDVAVIGGNTTADLLEDAGPLLNASGALTISDLDNGQAVFIAQTDTAGTSSLGTFNLMVDGTWSYEADNTQAAIQALGDGVVVTETFKAVSPDGTTQEITIAITGVNDISVIGGVSTGEVTEDTGAFLNVSGALTIADLDTTGVPVFVAQTNTIGSAGLGTFNLRVDGAWSFTADNTQATIQALDNGITTTDTFSAMSADGARQVVTVTIKGVNEQMELSAIELDSNAGGFVIHGASQNDQSGRSVSNAGDVNGDGLDDLIIGAHRADPNSTDINFDSGASYVVFGKESGEGIALSDIENGTGTFGFMITGGNTATYHGQSVSGAGDVNGDGLDDLIVGAPLGVAGAAGISFVVFGKADNAAIDLSTFPLNNLGGFKINGVSSNDQSGQSVSGAGDVNGDGKDDLIVGSFKDDPNDAINSGASFVVFGKADTTAVALSDIEDAVLNPLDLDGNTILDDPSGFAINGVAAGDLSGISVSGAGDVNGDGLDDLIIGASHDDTNGSNTGASFVVFGKAGSEVVELSTIGTGGFAINGISAGEATGSSVSGAGDVNGDGLDDVIVGAPFSGSDGVLSGAGFVVFGKTDTSAVKLSDIKSGIFNANDLNLNGLLDDPSGFAVSGLTSDALLGHSVSDAGDVNGDGFDDLILGAYNSDPNGSASGASFLIFGKVNGAEVDIQDIIGNSGGFAINGVSQNDQSGRSVSGAGDVNGDGFADLFIGAPLDDPNSLESAGASFVFFGGNLTRSVAQIGTTSADTISGTIEDEIIFAGAGDDTVAASPGIDRLSGGNGADIFIFSPDDGTTTIIDFSQSEGDQVDVSAFGFPNHVAVMDAIIVSGSNNSKLTLDPNTFIYFDNMVFNSFTAADFII